METSEQETEALRSIAQQTQSLSMTIEMCRTYWRAENEFRTHAQECAHCRFKIPTNFTCEEGFKKRIVSLTMFNVIGHKLGELREGNS